MSIPELAEDTPPALSVIMPVLNAAGTIDEAIASIAAASAGLRHEIIVVDGGSTDGTAELALGHRHVWLIAAPGTSIYQAVNIAFEASRAPLVAWLNADDQLLPGALDRIEAAFAADPAADIVRGQAEFIHSDGGGWQAHDRRIEKRMAGPLRLDLITRGPLAVNSMVFRRPLFERIGRFDEGLRLAADREWMLRAWLAGIRVGEVAAPVYRYRIHRGSSTLDPGRRHDRLVRSEHAAILDRYLPTVLGRPAGDPVRVELRRWHAAETALRLGALLRKGAVPAAARLALHESWIDPAWLGIAIRTAGQRLMRRSGR